MIEAKLNMSGFNRAFAVLEKTLERPTSFMQRPAEEWFADVVREQLSSEGRAGAHGAYPPLARTTLAEKARAGFGGKPILERTGAMKNALTQLGSLRQIVEVTDDKIIFHLPPPAGFHQKGTRNMPARRVVDPSAEQKRRLSDAVKREADDQLEGLGFNTRA